MPLPRIVLLMIPVGLMIPGAGVVWAQDYPHKPIRMVTGGTGGGTDFTARLIAQGITAGLGQQVIVDSRGSGGYISELVAKASPDGYTLLLHGTAHWLLPLLRAQVLYDPVRDFSPITTVGNSPSVLVVLPSLRARSVGELIALAKSRPGELNYASGPTGAAAHLSAELFKSMAGVDVVRVSYKGTAPAIIDLMAGQVQLMFANASAATPHIKSARLRALAVTSARPSLLFPDLPTMSASGLAGYESGSITGIFAPARTPVSIINRLNREIVQVLNRADVKEKFLNAGVETVASSPERLAATIRSEIVKWDKVIKDVGIRVD